MFDYTKIPVPHMAEEIRFYLENGVPPGGFLSALISNDLFETYRRADDQNRRALFEWVEWFYHEAPWESYGSLEKMDNWIQYFRRK